LMFTGRATTIVPCGSSLVHFLHLAGLLILSETAMVQPPPGTGTTAL